MVPIIVILLYLYGAGNGTNSYVVPTILVYIFFYGGFMLLGLVGRLILFIIDKKFSKDINSPDESTSKEENADDCTDSD